MALMITDDCINCDVCEPDRLLSACRACNHNDCTHDVPTLVAGFRANRTSPG